MLSTTNKGTDIPTSETAVAPIRMTLGEALSELSEQIGFAEEHLECVSLEEEKNRVPTSKVDNFLLMVESMRERLGRINAVLERL